MENLVFCWQSESTQRVIMNSIYKEDNDKTHTIECRDFNYCVKYT
jgi:hypothetical protein